MQQLEAFVTARWWLFAVLDQVETFRQPQNGSDPQEKTAKVNLVPPVNDLTLRFLDGGDDKFLWLENP